MFTLSSCNSTSVRPQEVILGFMHTWTKISQKMQIKSTVKKCFSYPLTLAFWQDEKEPEEDLFKHALSYYGGPPEISQLSSSKHVIAILNELLKDLQYLVQQRVGISSTNSIDE